MKTKIFLFILALCSLLSAQEVSTTTIAAGDSLSPGIEIGTPFMVTRITFPAAFDTSLISFQTSSDGITYTDVFKADSTEYTIKVVPGKSVILNPWESFCFASYIKIRSGTVSDHKPVAANRSFGVEKKRVQP